MTGVVILAAGAGRRLGGVAKALLRLPGSPGASTGVPVGLPEPDEVDRTFLEAIRDTCSLAGVTHTVTVVGPPHDRVTMAEADRLGLPWVRNPEPGRGMASSVALGFTHAAQAFGACTRALIWPVDHPAVTPATVRMIARAVTGTGIIAIPTLAGRGGHPTGFGRDVWHDLASCLNAPEGARSVIQHHRTRHPDQVQRIAVDDPAIVTDVDTPKQLENL